MGMGVGVDVVKLELRTWGVVVPERRRGGWTWGRVRGGGEAVVGFV